MLKDWNYIPLFTSYRFTMAELSNESFGQIVRAALKAEDMETRPDGLSDLEYMMYKIIIDDAERVYSMRLEKKRAKEKRISERRSSGAVPKDKYQPEGTDPEEALRLALEREFGEDEEEGGRGNSEK